jgi:hypothetical protein
MRQMLSLHTEFAPYRAAACLRAGYLFPALTCVPEGACDIAITAPSAAEAQQAVQTLRHLVYRERIYQQTLPLRETLYRGLLP